MPVLVRTLASVLVILGVAAVAGAQGRDILPPAPTPTDIKPGSITCDECPYPAPSRYLDINVYSQDVRISYMDIAPTGTANGHVVLLMHGNNFGGFYFGDIIDGLTDAGFRVVVPDQIGYGKSSKPIAPYNFNTQARNTQLILEHEGIDKVIAVGHSMGGMLATRFTTQYPDSVERLVIYNPIG
ncbi:MAG: alpha/beta fold hydrolase, partial [Acidobacteria bacterium]|nr:alpha/beta fold hydrolase [Acidobacteriota bacterium]